MLLFIWAVVIAAALYLYFHQLYSTFSSRGVKTIVPIAPFGNMTRVFFKLEHFTTHLSRCYYSFPKERFIGRYEFMIPTVMIRDVELIKKIAIKDFEHFIDHRNTIDENADPLFGRNLFSLRGQEWKDMRSTLSPAFTSSKIRVMVPFMVEVGEQMIKALKQKIKASTGSIDIDVKDLTTRYANDVIASCAFGLKVDSHMDEDNRFYEMGKATSTFTFKRVIIFFAFTSFPKIMKFLKFSMFTKSMKDFFRKLVTNTMQEREEKHIIRPDMIHLLMEAKKGKLTHEETNTKDPDAGFATVEESNVGKKEINRVWSDDDLVAQAILFIIAGFDGIASGMSLLLYELALHPEVQDKLAEEIRENFCQNNRKYEYNSIMNMTYLDMVVSETLRLWPPAIMLDRLCVRDYNCGKPNNESGEDFIIRRGTGLNIPVWSMHRDPEYFPDPLKFDPERFSEENKHNIKPFTYMPFGLGPRNCIGSRFALCEMKVMVYQLLQHMQVSPCEKTCVPPELEPGSFNIRLKGGHWARFQERLIK